MDYIDKYLEERDKQKKVESTLPPDVIILNDMFSKCAHLINVDIPKSITTSQNTTSIPKNISR